MKKLILLGALAATVVSCSTNEETDLRTSKAIAFESLNDRVSRAESTTTIKANDNSDDFLIFCRTSATSSKWFFTDFFDMAASELSNGTRYWPLSTETLDFMAYAPAAAETGVYTNVADAYGDGTASFTFTSNGTTDLTAATPILGRTSADNNGTVNFEFSHLLAKVKVTVVLSENMLENYKLENTIQTVLGVNSTSANFTLDMDETDNYVARTNTVAAAVMPACDNGVATLIIPQAIEADKFSITITGVKVLKSEDNSVFYDQAATELKHIIKIGEIIDSTDAADNDTFKEGKFYNITLTIDGDDIGSLPIKFSASVADWTDVSDTNGDIDLDFTDNE